VTLTTWHPLSAKVGNHFADSGGRSVGIVRSRDSDQGICFLVFYQVYANRSRDSSVTIVTSSRPSMGPAQSPGINRPVREADHSPPSSVSRLRMPGGTRRLPSLLLQFAWCLIKARAISPPLECFSGWFRVLRGAAL
jgi:hypothetical protein